MQLYHDCIPPCGSFIYSFAPIDECPFEALRAATVERVIVERRCRMSLSDVAFATSLSVFRCELPNENGNVRSPASGHRSRSSLPVRYCESILVERRFRWFVGGVELTSVEAAL